MKKNFPTHFNQKDLMLMHPFVLFLAGASGSGKSTQIALIIKHLEKLIYPSIKCVLYCYGVFNQSLLVLQKFAKENHIDFELHQGIPSEEMLNLKPKPLLLILDDLMIEAQSKYLTKLTTRESHHNDISVIIVAQHAFEKHLKTARNNSHYIMLMRNPAGELQIKNLGMQLFPGKQKYFMESYINATNENFQYLFLDLHPASHPILRLRTHIYPDEFTKIYLPK